MTINKNNAEKYKFVDFTFDKYRDLIRLAKKQHKFVSYDEFRNGVNCILWRHDVDYSIDNVLKLAQIEQEEGVMATYFIWLHSEFYNPLERKATAIIKEVLKCKHQIGLHFDC